MSKGRRIAIFTICAVLLALVFLMSRQELGLPAEIMAVLFSSMLMISFVALFLEHWFTVPTDVISSTISILLVMAPMHVLLSSIGPLYWLFFGYNLLLLVTSLTTLLLVDEKAPSSATRNRASLFLKRFSTFFGNGRFLYTVLFFLVLVFFADSRSYAFILLGLYVAAVLLIDPKKYILGLPDLGRRHHLDVGEIIGVQSKNTFIAKLYTRRTPLHRFDVVDFRYAMDEDQRCFRGLIIDNYLLNEQQWIKILSNEDLTRSLGGDLACKLPAMNVAYKVEVPQQPEHLSRLVGVVVEGSTISTLRFEFSARAQEVREGNILEVQAQKSTVLYQIIQATTRIELLESKNETGLVVGEATQLGVWDPKERRFDRFGWVPDINTPVFLAGVLEKTDPGQGEISIGILPGTTLSVFLNLSEAVTHHIAILGVTGSGKSVLARKLVRDISQSGVKVVCVDFTDEYNDRFQDLKILNILPEEARQTLFDAIDTLSDELDKFPNQRNKETMKNAEKNLRDGFRVAITSYLKSEKSVAIFDLPDVSNTTGILEYTKWFFRILFDIARKDPGLGCKLCVVIEEAHTVIPEWNFIGVEERKAQSVVNSISQIALQGRKYGIGFVVVAQRTANVSNTTLLDRP